MNMKRRDSLTSSAKKVYIDNNPLSGGSLSDTATIHVENIADAKPISSQDLEEVILEPIRFTDDNEERLDMLEVLKEPYIFSSSDLVKIVEVTPSLKTRITMIQMIGPRLSDPNAQVSTFTDMFRFAEQKQTVEDILKARMNAINASKFTSRTGGNTLLRGGSGGRGGRGGVAPALGGRGSASGRGRPMSTSVVPDLTRKLSSNSLSPKGGAKKSPVKTTEDLNPKADRKNPEICPEDSPTQTLPASSFLSPVKTTVVDRIETSSSGTGQVSAVINNTLSDSPNTDSETSTLYSSPTPTETHSAPAKTDHVEEHGRTALSPVPEVPTTSTVTAASITTPSATPTTSSTNAAVLEDSTNTNTTAGTTTPVPFVITARAIQKAPSAPTSRRGSAHNTSTATSNNTNSSTPVPTPNLTPVASSTNLTALGSTQSSAAPSPMSTHSAHSTHNTASTNPSPVPHTIHNGGGLSTSIAAYKDFDLAPMVADCKPEKGVSSLKSMFSGGGGNVSKSLPPKPPLDYTPAKIRPERLVDNGYVFKPATSTANSLHLFRPADTSSIGGMDARSQAPAPIFSGATMSLAEVRAKFGGGGISINTSPASLSSSSSGAVNRGGTHSEASSPSAPRVLVRRHSECALGSFNANSPTMLAVVAAANAAYSISPMGSASSNSSPSNASAETAGAGADLAFRCAAALGISRADFLLLEREDAVFSPDNTIDAAGSPKTPSVPQYTYREVVRRNFVKVYEELNQNELEKHVCDADFATVFLRTKEEYVKQPRWRQVEQKKKALLF